MQESEPSTYCLILLCHFKLSYDIFLHRSPKAKRGKGKKAKSQQTADIASVPTSLEAQPSAKQQKKEVQKVVPHVDLGTYLESMDASINACGCGSYKIAAELLRLSDEHMQTISTAADPCHSDAGG